MGPELSELRRLIETYEQAEKEGRVLSSKNSTKLRDAMAALHEVLKAAGLMDETMMAESKGEKCMDSSHAVPVMEVVGPYGGAKSFADLDTYMDTQDEQSAMRYTMNCAQGLMNNIMRDDDLEPAQKSSLLATLASELPDRISEPPDYAYKEDGLFARVRTAIFGSKTIKKEGKKFVLYSKDGSKKLGEFDSEEDAAKREGQVDFFKKKDDEDPVDDEIADDLFEELFGEKHPGNHSQSVHGKGSPKMSSGGAGRVQRAVTGGSNAGDDAHYKKKADVATKKAKKRPGSVAASRTAPAYDKKEADDVLLETLVGV